MKILVLSDSHCSRSFMCRCVDTIQPDVLIHLGDIYDDGLVLHERYPDIPIYQVAGNCDYLRAPISAREILIERIDGIQFYITHGHKHGVKQSTSGLIAQAHACKADAVLYGHTHTPDCHMDDGMWVLNPGACGTYGGSVGLIVTENRKIRSCNVIKSQDLEVFG